MAETPLASKHVKEVEMEPSISTPLQQEAKRKRPQNNGIEATKRKKPRKKMYRPKVIGEGRKRKSKGSNTTPAKQQPVTPNPKTPSRVVPKLTTRKPRPLPKPRTRKLVPCQKNSILLEDGCRDLAEFAEINAIESCRDLVLVENEREIEKFIEEVAAIEAKETEPDNRVDAIDSCRNLVLVENELEIEKVFEEVDAIETKEADKENSNITVVRTPVDLSESFCLTKECKRKRSSRRISRKIIERKPYGLRAAREKGRGSRKKLLPFLFSKRKRTPMVRRCNLASLFELPVCNQLPRNIHKHAVNSGKTEILNGNNIVPIVGWQLKRPRNQRKSQARIALQILNCSSGDDDGVTKIGELACQSAFDLNANGRETHVGTAITDVNKEEILTKGSAQTSISHAIGRETSIETALTNVNKEETLTKGSAQISLAQVNGLTQGNRRETSIGTALIDVNKEETLTKGSAQTSILQANGRDTSTGTTITDVNKEERLTRGVSQTSLPQASSKFSDMRSEGGLRKMGEHNEQVTMKWLDISHFLTNSRLRMGRSGNNPPENGLSIPRITTGSGGNLTRHQDFTFSAKPSGNANKVRPTLSMVLWNNREGIRNNHEHNRLKGETRGVLGEEMDSSCKRFLVPYAADGRYNEALSRNVSPYVATNNNNGLSHHLQKERTASVHEKQIIPYARKGGKKNSKHEHNPNSLDGMQGAIVPHSKSLNSTKKKEIGRVNLEPRDIIVWKVLFENDSNSEKEKIDEEWWENERKVFRGRINAFNAIMHVILGDRRFSPWKGSVVDSVVGVFLTQNVSDHLSSSAYMSLAATFPLPETENYHGEEIFCIQQSTQRNEKLFLCESKWDNGRMETNKATGDPEEAKELMSVDDAISSQDCQGLSIKENHDSTLLSSICLEDDCGTCLSKNLDDTDNLALHSNKSTFEKEPYSSSQNSTSSCGSNQKNRTSESKEVGWRDQNPISGNFNSSDTMHTPRSLGKCYSSAECISKSKSGLENNAEDSNRCEEIAVDLQFAPNEKSQGFFASTEKFQNQEIQLIGDVNAQCPLCSESNEGKMEAGSQLSSDIDDSSQKVDFDVEKVQSQESVTQASNNTNEAKEKEKKEAKGYLEDGNPNHLNDEKETNNPKGKAKKSKMKPEVDWNSLREKWDSMRREHPPCEPRSHDHMDSVDWEAVRCAEPTKIADAIKERGQHNIIAGRIKEFLDRTARLHGCIDLEWLRHAPPKDVKEYLLEIDGLGLKSVECIRLLALQQVAFPVDINVGRIAVRLGWVPLEPLPEEVQMHLLETFPMMDSIQKYLWPRLSMLDQRTLYELHYQLITFGKVFCTKRKPNCNACPLRADCRHYASAYASARLALPGPQEKGIVSTMAPEKSFEGNTQAMNSASVLHIDANPFSEATNNCEPIIEAPPSPEPAHDESQLTDIEDLYEYDSDDVPIIRLSSGQFTTTSLNCVDDTITKALVPLHTRVASAPLRKLKHIERLRTEHQAYELPDTHPLLSQLERREPNDPCPYLLCILSPGETVDSCEPPNTRCVYRETGEICTEGSCSSCNIIREQNSGAVRGTILIPCRTAMRGKFPLNGTYFQVNEVFADDETSKNPIQIPREWIWNLPRRIAYFGTSTTTIFRGLAKEDIQYCFQKGFICVRGFDRRTRTPKRLAERLHRATNASIKARANKNDDQKQKTYASNSNSPQQL
uniref:HhH-GPD domain-containing protein n=1 Tax=Cucumis melo TaxID=3656 RepID=A0A9I9DP18_CUCME